MPKAFGNEEKEEIKQTLITEGRRLFERYGIRKTSVSEIAKAAGIGKGTFYLFYQSKEELFIDVLDIFEGEMQQALILQIKESSLSKKDKLKKLLGFLFEKQYDNPLMEVLMNEKQMEEILSKIPEDKLEGFLNRDEAMVEQLGAFFGDSFTAFPPKVLSGLFRNLYVMNFQKRLIGEDVFDEVASLMIDFIADGLVKEDQ
ncbi:TetR/AcrR family transcriptional regulator [Spirochaeta cellobiosiphila]|uniref:TetR/AcrR family transcriptional regulator n=1 Tax=Spirochaeta cellobiosiphila TaxID=504483 RepID=UPI000405748E|nr:TetR/AcrR family transcriptional regulator [Spirochaeta cellobiosiphila]